MSKVTVEETSGAVLDLFSGIGGFSLGLERAGFNTVAFCEIEPYCRAVLAKHWPHVPCYTDVRELNADRLARDGIDAEIICGGFPCQDVSSAGDKAGLKGTRSGLWREFHRLIGELRPRYAVMENVDELRHRGLATVLGDLASIGYDAEWHSIPASFVGSPQARERLWIVAYPDCGGREGFEELHRPGPIVELRNDDDRLAVAQRRARDARSWVGRANDGVHHRVHRLRALGNSVVPEIPELIGRAIVRDMQ